MVVCEMYGKSKCRTWKTIEVGHCRNDMCLASKQSYSMAPIASNESIMVQQSNQARHKLHLPIVSRRNGAMFMINCRNQCASKKLAPQHAKCCQVKLTNFGLVCSLPRSTTTQCAQLGRSKRLVLLEQNKSHPKEYNKNGFGDWGQEQVNDLYYL